MCDHKYSNNQPDQVSVCYYGYKLSETEVLRYFLNTEFITNIKDFVMETDVDYFAGSDDESDNSDNSDNSDGKNYEKQPDIHKLKKFIQDYFNTDFFDNDSDPPISLVPLRCCETDRISEWVLGVKVSTREDNNMDVDEVDEEEWKEEECGYEEDNDTGDNSRDDECDDECDEEDDECDEVDVSSTNPNYQVPFGTESRLMEISRKYNLHTNPTFHMVNMVCDDTIFVSV